MRQIRNPCQYVHEPHRSTGDSYWDTGVESTGGRRSRQHWKTCLSWKAVSDWRRIGWSQADECSGKQMPRVINSRELLWPIISPRQWGVGLQALRLASMMKGALHLRELGRTEWRGRESLAKNLRQKATDLDIKNLCLTYTLLLPQDNLVEWGMVFDILQGLKYGKLVLIVVRENGLKLFVEF